MSRAAYKGIFIACLLKLCCKIVEVQFFTQDPSNYHLEEGSEEAGKQLIQRATCRFDNRNQTEDPRSSVTSWFYTARYMFPVLGGLISSAWLSHITILQIGGAIMLLTTVLMSVSSYLGLYCQSHPIIYITWPLLPLFYGLTQPSMVFGMFRWCREPRHRTLVSALYYGTYTFGEWIALVMSRLCEGGLFGSNCTISFICISILFISMAAFLPNETPEPFRLPTQQRMKKYFQVFSALILFLTSIVDTRSTVYISELNFYLNGTMYAYTHSWLSPDWMKILSISIFVPLIILITFISRGHVPWYPRLQAGILLEAAVELFLVFFTLFGSPGPRATLAIYSVASVLDGVAELTTMVAAYDMGSGFVSGTSIPFVMGIMFTVWGLSNIFSRSILLTLRSLPADNPVLHPTVTEKPQFYVYHVIVVVSLVICSIYHKVVVLPLAQQLTLCPDDVDDPESDNELEPLLTSV